jgi:hypothetical protein
MGVAKFEIFEELLPTCNQEKKTQWRRSIATEEKLALSLRLVHIPCNLLFQSSTEQFNTPQM